MAVEIDKRAVVDPKAEIDDGCHIGPFCIVGPHVVIGPRTVLKSHVVANGHTRIGADCEVFPFVTLGVQSQDQKYVPGTITYCEIGNRNVIREYVSIHSGTEEGTHTRIGDDCALLAHAHIAHNSIVGNHVTFSHAATIGGHVTVGDYANLAGLCAVHQFCNIGHAAMVAGMARVTQDVLPFTIAEGSPGRMRVVNRVGMERANYDAQTIREVRRAFRILFVREMRLNEAVEQVSKELGDKPHIKLMLDAIQNSTHGLARPDGATFEINAGDED